MSGVLNRMVQRARGELSAIEPLVTPQRTTLAAQVAPVEETQEHIAPARQLGGHVAEAREGTSQSQELKNPRAEVRTQTPASADGSGPTRYGSNDESQPLHETELTGQTRSAGSAAGAGSGDAPAKANPSLIEHELRVLEVHAARTASTDSGTRNTDDDELEMPITPMRRDLKLRRDEAVAEKKVQSRAVESKPRTGATEMEGANEHTEIHITIGSIEMRPPRSEAKAPAFRPRVTLDDFLSRRPGAGS